MRKSYTVFGAGEQKKKTVFIDKKLGYLKFFINKNKKKNLT